MKKQRVVVLTEQDLSNIIDKVLSTVGVSADDIFKGLKNKDNKSTSGSSSSDSSSSDSGKKSSLSSSGSVESKWMDVTKKVIDNFEGGYWNYWQCKNHPWHSMYKKSGETMFGLDRKAGNIENLSPEGREFFRLIDEEKKKLGISNFCSKWTYNYRGGDLEENLKNLASKIMFKEYEKNMSNYVKNSETKKRIEGNNGLLLHMAYATWNGPGFFKKFAEKLDRAVTEGKSDEELLNIAKNSRTNSFTGDWAKATVKVNSLIDKTSGMA
jgi:hypothetical protein